MTRYLIRPTAMIRRRMLTNLPGLHCGKISSKDRPHGRVSWPGTMFSMRVPPLGYVVATSRGLDHGPTVVFTYYYPLSDDDPKTAMN